MYCNKCGKEIPENSKFCGGCGTAVQTKTKPVAKKQKKEKKRAPIWVSLLVMAAAFLIGKFVMAPSMLSEPQQDQGSYQQEETSQSDSAAVSANGEYSEIFTSRNIVEMPAMFMMLDSAAFAAVDQDGIIEKMEFGYKDDVIKEMVNTLYFPISGMDDTEKSALEAMVKENLSGYLAVDFCTTSYNMGNLYYTVSLHFTDLDVAENIQKMSEFGILAGNGADRLSMAQTESNLIAGGYTKK